MVKRDELTQFIYQSLGDAFLEKAASLDEYPNRVQLSGSDAIHKVALGVSASELFIQRSIKQEAQYLIVHHGIAVNSLCLNGRFDFIQDRLKLLIKNNLTLASFHYALDAHPTLGNNAQIIEKLGAKRLEEPYFDLWGWVGEFNSPVSVSELRKKAKILFDHEIYAVMSGPKQVKRLGVCSGGARPKTSQLFEIIDLNLDLHLTGEIGESEIHKAQAGKFNYFACGHYATETFGVKALGAEIKKHFGAKLEVEFIDIPTTL